MQQTDRMDPAAHANGLGSPAAFTALYRQQSGGLLRYFYRRTADPEVAADLCAETFASALRNVRQYDAASGTQTQWLYGIAKRQLAMFWRRRKVSERARRRYGIPHEPIDEAAADELRRTEDVIDGAKAMEALDGLSEGLRRAVALRVVEELEYDEIAAELGCSPSAARVRVFRGLRELNEVLR